MCGIAGIVSDSLSAKETLARVAAMSRAQAHRGPDDCGNEIVSYEQETVAFRHRRLAIIDVTCAGHQPMVDPASGAWIVFNGEIYNFRELRRELAVCGHKFLTESDTEVLLKAFVQWGPSCVERLRGIFAFGAWD